MLERQGQDTEGGQDGGEDTPLAVWHEGRMLSLLPHSIAQSHSPNWPGFRKCRVDSTSEWGSRQESVAIFNPPQLIKYQAANSSVISITQKR